MLDKDKVQGHCRFISFLFFFGIKCVVVPCTFCVFFSVAPLDEMDDRCEFVYEAIRSFCSSHRTSTLSDDPFRM